VLAETNAIKNDAYSRLYRPYGADVHARVMEYIDSREGISRVVKIREAHKAFLGVELSEAELADLAGTYSRMVEEAVVAARWVAGAREFLEARAGRLPMAVISGTPEAEMRRIVEKRDMARYFVAVRGSPPKKPPIVRELLARHRLRAERTVFVGDAPFDREAALETGLRFIGRVPADRPSPFPDGTATVPDLTGLAAALEFAAA